MQVKKVSLLSVLIALCIVVAVFITISAGALSTPGKKQNPDRQEEMYIPKDVEHYHIPDNIWAP